MHHNHLRWFCINCGHIPNDEEIKIGYLGCEVSQNEILKFRREMSKEKIYFYFKLRKEMRSLMGIPDGVNFG